MDLIAVSALSPASKIMLGVERALNWMVDDT